MTNLNATDATGVTDGRSELGNKTFIEMLLV